jgi:serine/threonine-protein kinase HipA
VDDFNRIGALRLVDEKGRFLGPGDRYGTPQLVDLGRVSAAARRVEEGTEDYADLDYLQGKATSLGGLRPKCTLIDEDGSLAIGKFPSLNDERSIVRSEVLALRLVALAGCQAAVARVIRVDNTDIAVVHRFDRTAGGARIHYLSGGSLLQARREEDRSYTEIADAIRRISAAPSDDLRELWRRLLINLLITNVDDHLWNVGFLYAGEGRWRLSPAFDVNPFPEQRKRVEDLVERSLRSHYVTRATAV